MYGKKIAFLLGCIVVLQLSCLKAEEEQVQQDVPSDTRGFLTVPDSVNLASATTSIKLITPIELGSTTKVFPCCKVVQLTGSKIYTPASESTGCPMVHMTSKGTTFDLAHNCVTFNRSADNSCSSHCVGVEVGYSPNDLGSNIQTDSITIENGIFCNWDIAILIHAGVRNVTLRNLVMTNNVLPIAIIGENDGDDNEVCTIYLENISIVGNCEARLACLQWIRSKLIDGADYGGGVALNPSGYTADEIMQLECDPEADVVDTLEIYTGLYANAVSNIQLKNVSVSNIGFDLEDPETADQAEKTATYGMYFRDCTSLFMEDVESTKNKSGLTTVGMYFDECCVVSVKSANISNNYVSLISGVSTNEPGNAPANCPAGRWAAAVALRDVSVIEGCDVVLSKTEGIDNTWGVRVILNPVTRSNSFGFENITADFLRGDRVYGFDLGDLYKLDTSSARVPAGAMHKLRMKNISISSARGQNDSGATGYPENLIAQEFKGIYLGDGSRDIDFDQIKVESNIVDGSASGICSGIEFGASSTTGTGGDGGTGKAFGTLQNAQFDNMSISGNTGGSGIGRVVGIRGIATGTDGGTHTPVATDNIVENISIKNTYIRNNEFDGIRVVDDTGDTTPLTIRNLSMDHVALQASIAGHGCLLERVENLTGVYVDGDDNASVGLETIDVTTNVVMQQSSFDQNGSFGLKLGSDTLASAVEHVHLEHVRACVNGSDGINIAGNAKNSIIFEHVDTHENVGSGVNFSRSTPLTTFSWQHGSSTGNTVAGLTLIGTASALCLQDLLIKSNTTYGVNFDDVADTVSFKRVKCDANTLSGVRFAENITGFQVHDSTFCNNTIGIESLDTMTSMKLDEVVVDNNATIGIFAPTLHTAVWNDVQVNHNGSLTTHSGVNISIEADTFKGTRVTVDRNAGFGFLIDNANHFTLDDFSVSFNVSAGLTFDGVSESVVLKNGSIDNTSAGFFGLGFLDINGLDMSHVTVNGTSNEDADVAGIRISSEGNCIHLDHVRVCNTTATESAVNLGGAAYGIQFQDIQDGKFENVTVANTQALGTGTATSPAYGIYFGSSFSDPPSLRNFSLIDVAATGTLSSIHDAAGCFMQRAVGVQLHRVNFSGTASGIASTRSAIGWHMSGIATQGFESIYADGFICNDNQGGIARGIYVEDPGGMSTGKGLFIEAELKNGIANNNMSFTGVCTGISIEENGAQSFGACNVVLENVSACKNIARDGNVIGLHIQRPQTLTARHIKANENNSFLNSLAGPFSTHGIHFETATDNVILEDIIASNNSATNGDTIGIELDTSTALQVDGMIANANSSKTSAAAPTTVVSSVHGILCSTSLTGCTLHNLQACGNNTAHRTHAIHIFNPLDVVIKDVLASSNSSDQTGLVNGSPVLYQSIGLFIDGGQGVAIENVYASGNTETETNEDNLALSVDAGTAENVVNTTAAIAKHFPVAPESGAYGVFVNGTQCVSINGGSTCKNDGVRAFGTYMRNSGNHTIYELEASGNRARGTPWFDPDPFNGVTDPIAIPAAQQDTIFAGATGPVEVQIAYEEYIQALSQFNTQAVTGNVVDLCTAVSGGMNFGSTVSSTLDILWAIIAQYRRFSTALGIGCYNCNYVTIDNCRANDNHSDHDNAGGIAFYGCGNKGHVVQDNVTAYNACWTDSQRGGATFDIEGDTDVSEWLPFYTFVGALRFVSEVVNAGVPPDDTYTLTAITSPVTLAHIALNPTALTQPEGTVKPEDNWTLNERRLTVGFTAGPAVQNLYNFAPVGALVAGILLEGQRDSNVLQNNSYSNSAHAGLGCGIISDATSSTMFTDNKATANEADALGYAWGLADISYSTPNVWYKNWMYANRVDVFLNSSLMIMFDQTFSLGQMLPVKVLYPGSIGAMSVASALDNIIVEFSNCRQIEDCMSDCVKQRLEDLGIITSANVTPYPGCQSCS